MSLHGVVVVSSWSWRRDRVVSRDGRDLTCRSGDVGSGMVVVVERDVAERW